MSGGDGEAIPRKVNGIASGDGGHQVRVAVGDDVLHSLRLADAGRTISVRRTGLIGPDSKVFTIGSCFAVEIRRELRDRGLDCYPKYNEIEIDDERQLLDTWRNLNHYDTFAIRQELERAFDPDPDRYPLLPVRDDWDPGWDIEHPGFQDPYRKFVLGTDEDDLADAVRKVDDCVREALEIADVYVITLGLIETWVDTRTGHHVWSDFVQGVSPDPDRFRFHLSTYEENRDNLAWICETLHERYPERPVVITVSPVGLARTYTDRDIVSANTYSKSVLRAVAGAIDDAYDFVTYWPSYEIALKANLFKEDGRHVTREAVEFIVANFVDAHCEL